MNREVIEEVRATANVVDVIGAQVSLRKRGKNYLGLCPFHREKTPSFTVNDEKQIFHCFGCGASGSVFDFLMRSRNITFVEAVQDLAKRYGIPMPQPRETERGRRVRELTDRLHRVHELATEYFQKALRGQRFGEEARAYLRRRGITEEVVHDSKLGYAPPNWHGLEKYLLDKRIGQDVAVQAGLLARKSQHKVYDRFRNRLMFPIKDIAGRIVGFGGRSLDENPPKYLNSPETPIFHKGRILYGLDTARSLCRQQGEVLVVEGYFDLLSLCSQGIRHVVAPLGTALTRHHIRLLSRLAPQAVLIFDGDEAGLKAAMRVLEIFLREKMSARMLVLPEGMDPDDFLRKEGKEALHQGIKEARPLLEVFLEQSLADYDGTVSGKVRVVRAVAPMLNLVDSRISRETYLRMLSERLGVTEDVLREEMGWDSTAAAVRRGRQSQSQDGRVPSMEEVVLRILFHYPHWIPILEEVSAVEDFQGKNWIEAGRLMLKYFQRETRKLDLAGLLLELQDDELRKIVSAWSLETSPWPNEDAHHRLQEYVQGIKARKRRLEDDLKRLKTEIQAAERSQNESLLAELLAEFMAKKSALLAGGATANANVSKGEMV